MAVLSPYVYPQSQAARSLASEISASDVPLQLAVMTALYTAIGNGLFTCTVSMSGYSAANIQENMSLLSQMGYGVTLSSTTLTLTW